MDWDSIIQLFMKWVERINYFWKKKYKENFCSFNFEEFYKNDNEIKKLYDFCGLSINENQVKKIFKKIDRNRFVKN